MNTFIFANADIDDYDFCRKYMNFCYEDSIVICCDGGIRHAEALNIKPDYILGDFDSAKKETIEYYKNIGVKIKTFPVKKNYTDMEICIEFALDNIKSEKIIIFGAIGSRFDHTLTNANILMRTLNKDVDAVIANGHNIIRLIKDYIEITGEKGDIVSLIPLSSIVEGVTTDGLEYPLFNYTMEIGNSLGVSNVMTENTAHINIKDGYLFVIVSRD